jgi:carboxypeptidase Taq
MTVHSTKQLYNEYVTRMRKVADLRYSSALLQWDQETYLPVKGAPIRGQQIATLSELGHELFIASGFGDLLAELNQRSDLGKTERRNIELSLYDYLKLKKIPSEFVREMSETVNRSFHSWIEARKQNDFNYFAPDLHKLIQLKKQEASLLGYLDTPYDAFLNDHDKGTNTRLLDKVFDEIRSPLLDILAGIMRQPQVNDQFLAQFYPKQKQWDFGMELLKELGYDLEAGRQDLSEHPFTVNFNSQDVRITTRIDENDLSNMTWSCIHELGHALYEQGLPAEMYGLPLGEAASYSIHESQSRLWENHVGRSFAFWKKYLPLAQSYFPEQLNGVSVEHFYRGINKVQPSFIRTEADELTYHFHIMIRYELEKKLFEGALQTNDIPAFWNEQYRKYLDVKVPDDKTGCLQDVHWSHGSFGYFPTYSLGSFYAAQFYHFAADSVASQGVNNGIPDYRAILEWLRQQIHQYGRMYTSEELCGLVCGRPLDINYFISHLLDKYQKIYNF